MCVLCMLAMVEGCVQEARAVDGGLGATLATALARTSRSMSVSRVPRELEVGVRKRVSIPSHGVFPVVVTGLSGRGEGIGRRSLESCSCILCRDPSESAGDMLVGCMSNHSSYPSVTAMMQQTVRRAGGREEVDSTSHIQMPPRVETESPPEGDRVS